MPIQFTGERTIEGSTPIRVWLDHIARYEFAGRYVKEKNVLDIACGTGYGSKKLCDFAAAKVVGTDISEEAIDFARVKYGGGGLEFKIGNILDIDSPENYFDVITCFETIEHIKNQEKVFTELRRVLKSEGLLIISSPNRKLTPPSKLIDDHPNNPFHIIEYSAEEFVSILKGHFEILEVYGQRGINKLFFSLFFEKIVRKLLPVLYAPGRGSSALEKISSRKEFRYITVICKKTSCSKI